MNTVDRNILLGITAIGAAITIRYGWTEEKLELFGLNSKNTKQFIMAVTIVSGGILLIGAILKTKKTA